MNMKKNKRYNKRQTASHQIRVRVQCYLRKWYNVNATTRALIRIVSAVLMGDIALLTIQNYFPMMGHPPIPWRVFLREHWGTFLALHLFLCPIGFLKSAFDVEQFDNARQKEKEQKRQQYKNKDRKDTN